MYQNSLRASKGGKFGDILQELAKSLVLRDPC